MLDTLICPGQATIAYQLPRLGHSFTTRLVLASVSFSAGLLITMIVVGPFFG